MSLLGLLFDSGFDVVAGFDVFDIQSGFDVIAGFISWFKKNIEEQVLMFLDL